LREANTSLDALQREFEGVAAAKADAEQQLEELRKIQGAAELERLKAELKRQAEERQRAEKELRDQIDQTKAAIEQQKRDSAAELERASAGTQQQSQDRQRIESELREQQNAARTAAEQSAAALKEKEGQCAHLEEELTKIRQTRNELEQKQQKISADLESAQAELQQQSQERQRLEKELRDQQNAGRTSTEQSETALKEKTTEITRLEGELTKVRQARDEFEQQKRQITDDLDRAKADLQQQAQEHQRVETEVQNAARSAAQINTIALKEKEERCAKLEEELVRVRQARDEFEQQRLQGASELERVRVELQQTAQERERVETELKNAARSAAEQSELALKDKDARYVRLEEELANMRQERDEFEEQHRKTATELGRLKTESQQHSQEHKRAEADLREELEAAKSVADETANMIEEKIARCHQLEEDLTELRGVRDGLEEQQRQDAANLERVRAESQQQSQERQQTEADLRAKLDAATAAAEKNAVELTQSENRCVQLEEEIAGLRPMCAELQTQLHQSVQDLERARAGFQRQSQDRQRLEAELRIKFEAAKATAEQNTSRCTQLEEELAGLRPMCAELQQQLHQSVQDLERAKADFQQQLQQRRRIETELREQLDAAKAANAQSATDIQDKTSRCNLLEEALLGVRRVRDELEQEKNAGAAELERAKAELQRQAEDHQRIEADLRAHLGAAKTAAEESMAALKEKEAYWIRIEGELAQSRQTRDEFEQRKHEATTAFEVAKSDLEERSAKWQQLEAELRIQLDVAKAAGDHNAGALKEKEAQCNLLEIALAEARQTRDEFRQRSDEGTTEFAQAKAELLQQSQEIEEQLSAKLIAVAAAADQNAHMLKDKTDECNRLQEELSWSRHIRDELEQHKHEGAAELERIKADHERQLHERERIESDLREQLHVAESGGESNASALKEQEGRLTTMENDLAKARQARVEFEQLERQSAVELNRVRTEIQQLSEEIHEWEAECEKLTQANKELSRLREASAARLAFESATAAALEQGRPSTNEGESKNVGESFRLRAPSAVEVFLVGDFTNWREEAIPMEKNGDGEWTVTVKLPPGTYNYLFIVDREWCTDPECPTKVANQFGGQNSVRRIA
jgi:chromosome segregation ATPase